MPAETARALGLELGARKKRERKNTTPKMVNVDLAMACRGPTGPERTNGGPIWTATNNKPTRVAAAPAQTT